VGADLKEFHAVMAMFSVIYPTYFPEIITWEWNYVELLWIINGSVYTGIGAGTVEPAGRVATSFQIIHLISSMRIHYVKTDRSQESMLPMLNPTEFLTGPMSCVGLIVQSVM
jgi:hypothetical protein